MIALLLVFGVVVALLYPGLRPIKGLWIEALWDLLHLPTFFLVTCFLHNLWPDSWRGWGRLGITVTVAFLLALGTEWAQGFLGRSANWGDVAIDAAGIGLGLCWLRTCSDREERFPVWFLVLAAGVGWICLWPAWGTEWAEARLREQLPQLGDFSRWESRMLWRTQGNAQVEKTRDGLGVRIGEGRFSGVSFWSGGQDWSPYQRIVLEILNPGEAFELGVRIDDQDSQESKRWFSTSATIATGERQIEIPLPAGKEGTPTIDLGAVFRLALFTGLENEEREFVVKSAFLR